MRSSVLPLAFVVESCHDTDLALLYIAKRTPAPFACCNTASIFDRSTSICRSILKYILAKISFTPSIAIYTTITSAPESCFNSKTSCVCVCVCVCMHMCVYVCVYVYVCMCMFVFACMCMFMCMCVYLYVYVCLCVCCNFCF
jgi:hypothetical protein